MGPSLESKGCDAKSCALTDSDGGPAAVVDAVGPEGPEGADTAAGANVAMALARKE